MVEGKRNLEATITELVKAFPAAFTLDSSQVRPLKLGIKDDIYARSDMSHRRITAALRIYCGSASYLAACTEGAVRVDLAGEPAGSVIGAEVEHAVQALSLLSKITAKRVSKAAAAPRGTKPEATKRKLSSLPAARVPDQSKTISKGKPATAPAKSGPRPLSLDDLRKAAAARKFGR
jgi:ProP effector